MFTRAIDLALNVSHALQISPPDYVRSILGNPDSWSTETCPPTELKLAEVREWSKGLPALAHILIPAVPWKPRDVKLSLLRSAIQTLRRIPLPGSGQCDQSRPRKNDGSSSTASAPITAWYFSMPDICMPCSNVR